MTTHQVSNVAVPSGDSAANHSINKGAGGDGNWDFESASVLSVSKLLDGDLCDSELNGECQNY